MKTKNRLTTSQRKSSTKTTSTRKPTGNGKLKTGIQMEKSYRALVSGLISRSALAGRLGMSYGGDRDLYKSLGWNKEPTFDDYMVRYRRDGIGKRVVDAPVSASWRLRPQIEERVELREGVEKKETAFEKEWKLLVNERRIYHHIIRVDKLSGIGQYGILLLGFDDTDNADMEMPVEKAENLMWVKPYSEGNAAIKSYVTAPSDGRYGLPEVYEVKMSAPKGTQSESRLVHWTRVLHVAEGLLEDDINGTPRMECVLNWLVSLELVAGSSGEIWWRAAFPGLAFILDKDAQIDGTQTMALLETEIEKYTHDLQRWMKLQGMEIKNLSSDVANPASHVKVYISLTAGGSEIPQRILIGSERGELSSSQDETAWNKKVDGRRKNYCEPMILRPFIDRLIMVGVLGAPGAGYDVIWEDIIVPTDKEKAEVRKINSEALTVYANSLTAPDILPFEIFFKEIMEWDDEKIKKISESVAKDMIDQEKQSIEDEKMRLEEDELEFQRQKEDVAEGGRKEEKVEA